MERENVWKLYSEEDLKALTNLSEGYKDFLNHGKTERECVKKTVELAKKHGFIDLKDVIEQQLTLKAGDKVYYIGMDKTIVLFTLGQKPLTEGMHIIGSHIDSPRIDVKQNPLYEAGDMTYLDGHYYGGIKTYQYVTIPLAMHGVVAKKDGSIVNIVIGEDEDDPILVITDILIHLAAKQMEKTGSEIVDAEDLDVLVGSQPLKGEEKEAFKKNLLAVLKEKYQIEEEDFFSAELEIVPAGKARDCGIDRSMVASYGQDDRVCAYSSLAAFLDAPEVAYTSCLLLVDKEEIGSVGATGMQSRFFENAVAELLNVLGEYSELNIRRTLSRSKVLSSDVAAGFDPLYANVFDTKNSAYIGRGVVFSKFTGARGKRSSNDANAEYLAWLRQVMDEANVGYQSAEIGKVNVGGGGTIAFIIALYGMEVVDCGVPILSMHSPLEVASKADIYEAYKGYKAFFKAK
ncbi:MAG: aminopeptidase [Erysipelotrichaceae bacterium]|nr:aminopeptidase [Erysipelotrichaceae bacterium]